MTHKLFCIQDRITGDWFTTALPNHCPRDQWTANFEFAAVGFHDTMNAHWLADQREAGRDPVSVPFVGESPK